ERRAARPGASRARERLADLAVPETFGRTWFDGSALKTAIWLWGNRSSVVKVPPTTTPPAPSTASLAALKLLTFGFQGMTVPVASSTAARRLRVWLPLIEFGPLKLPAM